MFIKKMHKVDLIFIFGLLFLGILGGVSDAFFWKDSIESAFPVFSGYSIMFSYAFWIILLIYTFFQHNKNQNKPKICKWYMGFFLVFFQFFITLLGFFFATFFIDLFNL